MRTWSASRPARRAAAMPIATFDSARLLKACATSASRGASPPAEGVQAGARDGRGAREHGPRWRLLPCSGPVGPQGGLSCHEQARGWLRREPLPPTASETACGWRMQRKANNAPRLSLFLAFLVELGPGPPGAAGRGRGLASLPSAFPSGSRSRGEVGPGSACFVCFCFACLFNGCRRAGHAPSTRDADKEGATDEGGDVAATPGTLAR